MKTLLSFLLLGLLAVTARAAEPSDELPQAPQGKSFKLVWHDEFDGDTLDGSEWDVPNNRRRDGTEIDIMEKPWLDDRITQNVHWDGYGEHHRHKGTTVNVPGIMEGWHTFALWWKADEYVFYVDGKETWRTDAGGVCQVPLYIKLSDEIGDWAGDITKVKLPDRFLVDYVRVYDLVDAE